MRCCAAAMLHSKCHLIETNDSPAVTQRELWDWEDLNAVFCFSFLFSLVDVRVTVARTHECKGGRFYLRKPKTVTRWVHVILGFDDFSLPFLSLPAHMWNRLLLNADFKREHLESKRKVSSDVFVYPGLEWALFPWCPWMHQRAESEAFRQILSFLVVKLLLKTVYYS